MKTMAHPPPRSGISKDGEGRRRWESGGGGVRKEWKRGEEYEWERTGRVMQGGTCLLREIAGRYCCLAGKGKR
jgi:hypothetical protein